MADFKRSIGIILAHEGGLVDHPKDPGGITNYGVSMRFVRAELQRDLDGDGFSDGDFDHDGDIDADDIRKMTVTQAMDVYKRFWWDKHHYAIFTDQDVATKVMDMSVNMGHNRAHIIAQTAVNQLRSPALTVDGVLGSKSFNAMNECDGQRLLQELCRQQAGFYKRLVDQKPSMGVFLKGWMRRAAWPYSRVP